VIHPDDVQRLADWDLYGPREPAIGNLVWRLAETGMRLDEVEAVIVEALSRRLGEQSDDEGQV